MSRQQLHITLARRESVVDAGTTAGDALQVGGGQPTAGTVIAARVNGALRDLARRHWPRGDEVEPVDITSEDGLVILRHSTAHVMAQAVQGLFPRPSSASARRWRTASTTTSTCRTHSARTI